MLIPCIHFPDNCDEAITFYKDVFNANVKEIAYAKEAPPDSGMEDCPPNFVMYSELEIYGCVISMSDGGETPIPSGNFSFMIMLDTDDEVTALFNKIADGGNVVEPLAPQFWSPMYGSVKDRFGVEWQVMRREC